MHIAGTLFRRIVHSICYIYQTKDQENHVIITVLYRWRSSHRRSGYEYRSSRPLRSDGSLRGRQDS
jgi:hypothetical protein